MITKKPGRPKQKREKSTSTTGHYVTNGVLLPAVIEAKALGKVTDKLIRMVQMIATRYSRKSNFIGYSFREDMVSAAVMNLCNNALKFNPEKSSNPFSFYTTAIHNSFLQYMADEKKHRNIRDALLIDAGSNPSFNFMQGEKDEQHFELKESDEVVEVIREHAYDDGVEAPVAKPKPLAEGEVAPVVVPIIRETKTGYFGRVPGLVTRYGPKDIMINEDGSITINRPEPVAVKKVRKTPVKKVVAVATKPATKKVVAKKAVAKPEPKKAVKKVATKPATKKVAAKKTIGLL